MLIAAKALSLILVLLLAGCATPPPRKQVGDWQSEELAVAQPSVPATPTPTPVPPLAPPPTLGQKPPTLFPDKWVPLPRWCKANDLPAPSLLGKTPPTFALTTGRGVIILRPGSQVVQCDGLELRLGFAPQSINGEPFVHQLDLQKTIAPLIASLQPGFELQEAHSAEGGRKPVIVLDPGHGGEDPGTQSVLGRRHEKDYSLDWALRLQGLLATNGWQVFLTRSNDSELSLSNRVLFAQNNKADLFVSLHFNSAAPNDAEAGLETYCLTPAGLPSTVTRGYADDPGVTFPNNAFDLENLQFAVRVHRALLQINGRLDRGVRRARYLGVLRGQQRPAILVEGGYLSNPREARLIDDPAYRQRLAAAIASALALPAAPLQNDAQPAADPSPSDPTPDPNH